VTIDFAWAGTRSAEPSLHHETTVRTSYWDTPQAKPARTALTAVLQAFRQPASSRSCGLG
jgi:hypothetical protein